ncbi:MAG TPA: hypothetical protein VJZ00_08350 [Thermoanaerobaculia bacterium]|nr:hypothetical protein [Thermoanaerobaculia bacterium]
MRRFALLIVAVVCAACKPAPPKPAKPSTVPMTRATVVTIRTTIQPGNRTLTHTLVIQGDRARSTAEHETWRFFDVKAKTVTFVDDVERTIRTEPLTSIVKRRRAATSARLPAHYASVRFTRGNERRMLQGVAAQQSIIQSGAYRRELWLAEHPSIPRGLFAMMHAAETPSSPLAPMMRAVDDALSTVQGFPLLDHSVVPYGNKKMVIERAVVSIAQQNVPAASIAIPAGYRDLTKPAASPRPSS